MRISTPSPVDHGINFKPVRTPGFQAPGGLRRGSVFWSLVCILLSIIPGKADAPRGAVAMPAPSGFDFTSEPASWPTPPLEIDLAFPPEGKIFSQDFAARAWLLWDERNLYVGVVVVDDQHIPGQPDRLWDGDVVQFILHGGDPRLRNNLLVALLDQGTEVHRAWNVGSLPSGPLGPEKVRAQVRKDANTTVYNIQIPWPELHGVKPGAGRPLRFSLGAIDADSASDMAHDIASRATQMLRWTKGVFGGNPPDELGKLILVGEPRFEAMKDATDWGNFEKPPALCTGGDRIPLAATCTPFMAQYVKGVQIEALDAEGQAVARLEPHAEQSQDGSMRWIAEWDTAGAGDGKYRVRAVFNGADQARRTVEHEIQIATKDVEEIERLLSDAAKLGLQNASKLDHLAKQGLKRTSKQARKQLALGDKVMALDCAQQALGWAGMANLPKPELPPFDPPPPPGAPLPKEGFRKGSVAIEETDSHWTIQSEKGIGLRWDKSTLDIAISASGQTWAMQNKNPVSLTFRSGDAYVTVPATEARSRQAFVNEGKDRIGLSLLLRDWPQAPGAAVRLDLAMDTRRGEALLQVIPADNSASETVLTQINWPGPMRIDSHEAGYWVYPAHGGCVVPSDWPHAIDRLLPIGGYFIRHPYNALFRNGKGLLQFFPDHSDAQIRILAEPGRFVETRVDWLPCWNEMRYPRTVRLAVLEEGGYVAAAKWYRAWLKEKGLFLSLKEKFKRSPSLAALHGGAMARVPVFDRDRVTGVQKPVNSFDEIGAGIERLANWGLPTGHLELTYWHEHDTYWTPDMSPDKTAGGWEGFRRLRETCHANGWKFSFYDCLNDFYEIFDRVYRFENFNKNADGLPKLIKFYPLGRSAQMAPARYLTFLKTVLDVMEKNGALMDIYYFDVFIANTQEDFDPRHLSTRYGTVLRRIEALRYARERGLAAKVESETYVGLNEIDLPWSAFPPDFGLPVPLTHLALHDSMLISGVMRDFREWSGRNGPMQSKPAFLRAALQGEYPVLFLNGRFNAPPRYTQGSRFVAALHRNTGLAEMTDHRFVGGDPLIQETAFDNGARIRADFRNLTLTVTGIEGVSPKPSPAISYGFDFKIDAKVSQTGPRSFAVRLTLAERMFPPDVPVVLDLYAEVDGKRINSRAPNRIEVRPDQWGNGQFALPEMTVELPPKVTGNSVDLSLRVLSIEPEAVLLQEGSEIGAAERKLGTVKLVRGKGGDIESLFLEMPKPWPAPAWTQYRGPAPQ